MNIPTFKGFCICEAEAAGQVLFVYMRSPMSGAFCRFMLVVVKRDLASLSTISRHLSTATAHRALSDSERVDVEKGGRVLPPGPTVVDVTANRISKS